MKNKKPLIITLIALDAIITIALLVISIIMLVMLGKYQTIDAMPQGFFKYLGEHRTLYFCAFVLPLFILLAANIIALVLYVKKSSASEPVKVKDLSEEQRAALRKQLLEEMKKQDTSEKKEESESSKTEESVKEEK